MDVPAPVDGHAELQSGRPHAAPAPLLAVGAPQGANGGDLQRHARPDGAPAPAPAAFDRGEAAQRAPLGPNGRQVLLDAILGRRQNAAGRDVGEAAASDSGDDVPQDGERDRRDAMNAMDAMDVPMPLLADDASSSDDNDDDHPEVDDDEEEDVDGGGGGDDDDDAWLHGGDAGGGGGVPDEAAALRHLLRLYAGPHVARRRQQQPGRPPSNATLLASLKSSGALTKPSVIQAMRLCSRALFVPPQYGAQAFTDLPIRVMEHSFNISAPHMHATCLEALDMHPGDRFLDVGCGCGVVTAAAAHIVGRGGVSVGMDIKPACITMSQASTRKLRHDNGGYAASACEAVFERHNAFVPSLRHRGRYTHIHVGATCPDDRVAALLHMLTPQGGRVIVPVDNELRMVTKAEDGTVTQRVITQVRFSDLEVPRDLDLVLDATREAEEAARRITVPASTFSKDMALLCSASRTAAASSASPSSSSSPMAGVEVASPAIAGEGSSSSGGGAAAGGGDVKRTKRCRKARAAAASALPPCPDDSSRPSCSSLAADADVAAVEPHMVAQQLGERDVTLVGAGWQMAAHRSVLEARCGLFRAQFNSGMRDAATPSLEVPADFGREAVEGLVHYVYQDELPLPLSEQQVVDLLLVAAYYGCARLIVLCEVWLSDALLANDDVDLAAQLLVLADNNGLTQLSRVVMSYAVEHFERLCVSEAYAQLPRHLVTALAHACCQRYHQLLQLMREAAAPPLDPPPLNTRLPYLPFF